MIRARLPIRSSLTAMVVAIPFLLPAEASAAVPSMVATHISPALLFGVAIFGPTALLAIGCAAGFIADLLQRNEAANEPQ